MENTEMDEGGRPEFMPTPADIAWVIRAASQGVPQEFITMKVVNPDTGKPVTVKTLRKHFRTALDEGLGQVAVELMTTAYEIATDKTHDRCVPMNIWMQKTRLGMKEVTVNEIIGQGSGTGGIPQLVVIRNGNTDAPTNDTDGSD